MECHTCHNQFNSWELLARHILQSHPYSRGAQWANSYVRKHKSYWHSEQRRESERTTQPNWKTTNEPVQVQIINFFAELYKMQDMGFNDNEILTMINLGKRKAGRQRAMTTGTCLGVVTDAWTDEVYTAEFTWKVEELSQEKKEYWKNYSQKHTHILSLYGITGFEGFYTSTKEVEEDWGENRVPIGECWVANFGTKHRYDKLEIPRCEMLHIFRESGLL